MLVLFLAIFLALELARRLPLLACFRALGRLSTRSATTLKRRRVSEWCKERAIQILSRRMFIASVRAGLLLALVAAPIGLALYLDTLVPLGVRHAFLDWRERLLLLLLCVSYAILRWQIRRRLRAV